MLSINIPGGPSFQLTHAIFDFNGTLAVDGRLAPATLSQLESLKASLEVIVATADTYDTAEATFGAAHVPWHKVANGEEKRQLVYRLGAGVVAVGNGSNDVPMFRAAALAVAVLGPEGLSTKALLHADIVVPTIDRVFELLANPDRIVATLRT